MMHVQQNVKYFPIRHPCCHLYSGYIQLYSCNKPCFYGMVYSVAAVLYLLFVLHVVLFRPLKYFLCYYYYYFIAEKSNTAVKIVRNIPEYCL
jgi:hypothetical protein